MVESVNLDQLELQLVDNQWLGGYVIAIFIDV